MSVDEVYKCFNLHFYRADDNAGGWCGLYNSDKFGPKFSYLWWIGVFK